MAYASTHTHFGQTLVARIRSLIEALKVARTQRASYARTVSELEVLSDRELHDLGISRYEIHKIAERHVYGL